MCCPSVAHAAAPQSVHLLDDHDLVRHGLRELLTPARDIQVVGESRDAKRAVQAILDLEADVMVFDLQLQDGTGIEVFREVRSRRPTVTGLLLTSFDDDEALVAAIADVHRQVDPKR